MSAQHPAGFHVTCWNKARTGCGVFSCTSRAELQRQWNAMKPEQRNRCSVSDGWTGARFPMPGDMEVSDVEWLCRREG